MIWYITVGFMLWNSIGFAILDYLFPAGKVKDFFNPRAIYRNRRVNYFGCAMLTLLAHILSPLVAFCYWFYVLCTVGRK